MIINKALLTPRNIVVIGLMSMAFTWTIHRIFIRNNVDKRKIPRAVPSAGKDDGRKTERGDVVDMSLYSASGNDRD